MIITLQIPSIAESGVGRSCMIKLRAFAAIGLFLIAILTINGQFVRWTELNTTLGSSKSALFGEYESLDGNERSRLQQVAKSALAGSPLDQRALNLVFVECLLQECATQQRSELALRVANLGWRHTPTQQNLVFFAAKNLDLSKVVLHSDGLLRRNKLPDETLRIMYAAEQDIQARAYLAERLSLNPPWRPAYFRTQHSPLRKTAVVARISLFMDLSVAPNGLRRNELVPSLEQMISDGYIDEAYSAFLQLSKRKRSVDDIILDSNFVTLSRTYPANEPSLPFEWTILANEDAYWTFSDDAPRLVLVWEGAERRPLMQQWIVNERGGGFQIAVIAAVSGGPPRRYKWNVSCEASNLTVVRQVAEDREGWPFDMSLANSRGCGYGLLQFVGNDRQLKRQETLSLYSINATSL